MTEGEQKVKSGWMHEFTGCGLMCTIRQKGISLCRFIDRALSASAAMTISAAMLCFTVYEH